MSVRLSGPPATAGGSRVDARRLRARAREVLRSVGHGRAELSLSLVDDDEMAEINLRYRGIDRPTDVLSFSLVEGDCAEHRGGLLGDVVIGEGSVIGGNVWLTESVPAESKIFGRPREARDTEG